MSEQDEDKPTQVLDIEFLKKKKKEKEEELASSVCDLEFIHDIKEEKKLFPVIFFNFNADEFPAKDTLPVGFEYSNCHDLKELNLKLKRNAPKIIAFYYDSNPKAVNQLLTQIKSKFKNVSTIVLAKSLSKDKVDKHLKTTAAADAYLELPLSNEKLKKELTRIESSLKKAS